MCFIFRVLVFVTPRGSEFFGSEFSRHPEGLSFSGLGSKFLSSEFSRNPEGLSFSGLGSKFSKSEFLRHPFPDKIKKYM